MKNLRVDIEDRARQDGSFAIAYALLELSEAQNRTARALHNLGLADAATPLGAMEVLSIEFKRMADALQFMVDRTEERAHDATP